MEKGTVFDIKEFAVFDGPGVRQTVFLKGCPLRCSWCHNPEGLSIKPQLIITDNGCLECDACKNVCLHDPCTVCGKCVEVCPLGLRKIAGKIVTSSELIDTVKINSDYYNTYGGGVTFSGGEPLLQADFLAEVLDGLDGIHKAIQTSGYAKSEDFIKIIDRLDYVMFDIKHTDCKTHKEYTGVENTQILKNLEVLKKHTVPFMARIPVIPGVNDSKENFENTAKLLEGADNLLGVELLPYHKTAGAKYSQVGMEYNPRFDVNKSVKIYLDVFENKGIRSKVL